MDDALAFLSRSLDSQEDCSSHVALEFPFLGSTRELLLALTDWVLSCPSSKLLRVSLISSYALWSLLVKETNVATPGEKITRPVRDTAVSPVFDALRTTVFKDGVTSLPQDTIPMLSVCYHGWSCYFTPSRAGLFADESSFRSAGALLAADISRAVLLSSREGSSETQKESNFNFFLSSEQAISLLLQSSGVDLLSLFMAASEMPSPPPIDLPWPLRVLSPSRVAILLLFAHEASLIPLRNTGSKFPTPAPHLDGQLISLDSACKQLFPFQSLPSLLPSVIPSALRFKWILWLTAPIAEELTSIWSSLEYSSIDANEKNFGAIEGMVDDVPHPQTQSARLKHTNSLILQKLGSPWLTHVSNAVTFYQGHSPLVPFLPLLIPGWHPCDDLAIPPPENVAVVVLGGLMTAVARAHNEMLSLNSRTSLLGLLSLFQPSIAVKLLCTSLPLCPFKQVSSLVLGWVQKCVMTSISCDDGLFFVSLHGLIQSLVGERLEQGLLLSLEEGGNKVDDWHGLCTSFCAFSDSSKQEALALRVSSHLQSLSDSDLPLLSLIRALLLKGKALFGTLGSSGVRTLLLPSQSFQLLNSFALPLMSGLVPAQKASKENLQMQAAPNPLPFSAQDLPAPSSTRIFASSKGSLGGGQLSSLFLLECTLSPTIELLEWWGANVK